MYESRLPAFGVLLVSGLTAGILAYAMSRRASRRERMAMTSPSMVMDRMRDLGDTEAGRAGREFLSERVVPEMKPVMLDLLKELEEYVDNYFRRAEKAVKTM